VCKPWQVSPLIAAPKTQADYRDAMLRVAVALVLITACGGASPPTPVPRAPVGDHGVDVSNLESQLGAYLASVGAGVPDAAFSGYVMVAQHDQPIFSRGYGFADRGAKRPPTADTSFRIGSVTKQFTATAILKLEQDGKLRVEDTVGKILSDYTGPAKDVTIHQLLTHTAGVPSFTDAPGYEAIKNKPHSPAQLLALFADQPLAFPPGTKHVYSNSGYVLLGAIIERASGMTYAKYLGDALFAPAGMSSTEVGDAPSARDRAEGYQLDPKDHAVAADPIDMTVPFAAGAVRSTANDLMRWHRAISSDVILKQPARAKLYKPALDDYAHGWGVREIDGRRVYSHGGGIDGFRTAYMRLPESDVVIIAWTNVLGVDFDELDGVAFAATFGKNVPPIAKIEKGRVDPAVTARLAGTYQLDEKSKAAAAALGLPEAVLASVMSITVTANPEGITMKPVGQDALEMIPLADGSFWAKGPKVQISFVVPASGPIIEVVLKQGPLGLTYRR
jgi:CubicO group peptidase (beta-lactamase class C family)